VVKNKRCAKEYFEKEFEHEDPFHFFTSGYEQCKYKKEIGLIKNRVIPKRILEIGCAEGAHTKLLAEAFPKAQITAVEISSNAIGRAEKNLDEIKNVKLINADIVDYIENFPNNFFDLIVWSECIYYIGDRLTTCQIFEFLKMIAKKLRSNGLLCMTNMITPYNGDMLSTKTSLSEKPVMECYHLMLSYIMKAIHKSSYSDYKKEEKKSHEYQIWIFKK